MSFSILHNFFELWNNTYNIKFVIFTISYHNSKRCLSVFTVNRQKRKDNYSCKL